VLGTHTGLECYADLGRMLDSEQLGAVVVSTPSKLQADMVKNALQRGPHAFRKRSFMLDAPDGERLIALAEANSPATQVG